MNKFYKLSIVLVFLLISGSFAQSDVFNRGHLIPVPVEENTGFGEFIAGVDFDGDGLKEIYAVNNMLDQGGAELIPRIYKFEFDGTTWDSVWSATITDIPQQNSWAALTYGDLDKDGKMEIIWGPANNFSSENVNPPRILVFESAGDGSNALGVDIFGNYKPNCQWTITEENNKEVRPFVWTVEDIDSDGVMEICFADRQQNYWFGVVSVSDVPDFADGSETWTLEHSGVNSGIHASTLYDLAVIDNAMYLFHSDGWVSIVEYAGGSWKAPVSLEAKVPGGSWKGAQAVDVNGDGVKEILVGGWTSGNNNVYLLEPDPFEVLRSRTIANLSSHIGSLGRFNGSTFGDIDLDKKMDLVFGTRGATPNGAILRMEYQSGDIADSSSYIFTVIDSLISDLSTQRFDIVNIAN
ncbi:MAG: VCBS repeat-containing protein, partial [Bacteroidetes bacterium]|nr:VCBS repeat-containing protein [Bacteroidota bacterium]